MKNRLINEIKNDDYLPIQNLNSHIEKKYKIMKNDKFLFYFLCL